MTTISFFDSLSILSILSLSSHSLRLVVKSRQAWLCALTTISSSITAQTSPHPGLDMFCFIYAHCSDHFWHVIRKLQKKISHKKISDIFCLLLPGTLKRELSPVTGKWTTTSSLHVSTAKHIMAKRNIAALSFAYIANFGNVRSGIYFKEEIALSVLQTCWRVFTHLKPAFFFPLSNPKNYIYLLSYWCFSRIKAYSRRTRQYFIPMQLVRLCGLCCL